MNYEMSMKKIVGLFAGLLVLLSNPGASAQEKSLLWKISGNGLAKPSFLFGTMHIICSTDYVWTTAMKNALAKSEKVCFEMDMDDMSLLMKVAEGLKDESGKKLSDYFTEEQYARLRQYVKDTLKMSLASFEGMKPMALQMMMSSRVGPCEDPVSYEERIMATAAKDKKEILGLETAEEQLKAIDIIPIDSTISEVLAVLENKADDGQEYTAMIKAYKAQDITALQKMINDAEGYGDYTATLLDDRNQKWISRMAGMMGKSSVFFGVGAGHLGGDKGVINLLRKQGYTVVAVK